MEVRCKHNEVGGGGASTTRRKKEAVVAVKCTFGYFLCPDIWAPIFYLSIFNVCKNVFEWVPSVVGGGGSNSVGHGTTSSASHQTLLVLN